MKLGYVVCLFSLIYFSLYVEELKVNNLFKLDLGSKIKIESNTGYIFYDNEKSTIRYDISFSYDNYSYAGKIYLKPYSNVTASLLSKIYTNYEVISANTSIGLGSVKQVMDNSKDVRKSSINNFNIKKYIAVWGSDMTHDILVYDIDVSNVGYNDLFSECLIEIYDVWYTHNKTYPKNFGIRSLTTMRDKANLAIEMYDTLDNIMSKITDTDKISYLFYTPAIDNLRFRENPVGSSKIIRKLVKGEKLELIEKGKEEIINNVQGTWVKVKTEQSEEGWCFDAYLKEIK